MLLVVRDFELTIDGVVYGMQRFGGLITYWNSLITGLDEAGIPVTLLAPTPLKAPLPVMRFRSSQPRKVARESVFHSTYYTLPDPRIGASVVTVHDMIYHDDPGTRELFDPDSLVLERIVSCIEHATAIVVPSHATARRLRAHFPSSSEPIVVPHGVDPVFRTSPAADRTVDERTTHAPAASTWGGGSYLLHVGGREAYKNFLTVLAAYLDPTISALGHLIVVGSQTEPLPAEDRMLRQVRGARDRVHFVGFVTQGHLASLYRGASVVVSGSRVEGFGLPIIEAAASGAPVACSRIDAYEETLGDAAVFFDPEDVDSCRTAIEAAATRGDFARSNAAAIRARFGWARVVDEMVDVYRSAASS